MKITKEKLKQLIKEELGKAENNIDEGLFDEDGMLSFLNPNNWADPLGIQTYMKKQKQQQTVAAKSQDKKKKAAATKAQQQQAVKLQKVLDAQPGLLKKRSQAYAKNDYSMDGFATDINTLPKSRGITYSEPLAMTMYEIALGLGLTPVKGAYDDFVKQFNSDKQFASKIQDALKPSIDAISADMYNALVDYGQGFGPKTKDGTPFDKAGLREKVMKITKQRLKEIIKEELENSQNEGFGDAISAMYGRTKAALGFGNKYWNGSSGIEKKFKPMVDNFVDEYPDISRLSSRQLRQLVDDGMALRDDYIDGAEARIGNDAYYTMDKDQKERYMVQSERISKLVMGALAIVNEKAQSESDQRAAQELARKARRKEEEEKEANEKWRREYYANRKSEKDPLDARPNRWMGSVDRKSKTFGFGANESKITKDALKSIITEELAKVKSK